jgi:putative SOS response-associated peptidase YedK
MCSHYQALQDRARYLRQFGVEPPAEAGKVDVWPGYLASFIRRHPQVDGDETARQALPGMFGLVPHWAENTQIARHTYNARSETVAIKPSFRDAWRLGRHCIIPIDAFYEPDWRSGRAVATRITAADGAPLGIAGLWSVWQSPQGASVFSYTLLTLNADDHPLMKQFHKPTDEKRMVVILAPEQYQDWLDTSPEHSMALLQQLPQTELQAVVPAEDTNPSFF